MGQVLSDRAEQLGAVPARGCFSHAHALASMLDGVLVAAPSGFIVMANDAAAEIFGVPQHELLAPIAEYPARFGLQAPSGDPPVPLAERALAGETVPPVERHIRTPAGVEKTIRASATPLLDGQGAVTSAVVLLADVTEQKRHEESLRSEYEFTRAVLDTIASLVLVLDEDGNIVRVNRACELATGYSASELIGKPVFELLIPADELPGTRETFRQLRAGHFPNEHENRWRMKDGAERLFHWANTAITDELGDVKFVIATGIDVTDRKRAAEALRRGDEKLRLAEDAARMGSWDWDLVTNELVWSPRCKVLFEVPHDAVVTYPIFRDSIHPDDRARVEARIQAALDGAGAYDTEMRVPLPDGSVRWIQSVGRAFFDERGAPVRMAGMALDVTERKRREINQRLLAAMAGDFARLATEQEITTAIGATLAAHLDITTCSIADFAAGMATVRSAFTSPGAPAAATTLRVSDYLDEALEDAARAGQTIVIRDARTDPRVAAERYEALGVRSGIVVPFLVGGEWKYSFAVGTPHARDWRDDEIRLVEEVASHFFARIGRARAEEALARANEQLTEADRRKTEFLGVLSHELRNPLAPIRNSIYLLEKVPAGSPQAARAREVIRRQAEHLTRLVDDLLDVTRISRGKVQLRREVLDLRDVVRRTCEDHRIVFEDSEQELSLDFPAAPVFADVDPTRIAQVVGNLLHNANKFTPAHGAVTVRLRGRGGHAEITVRDTGTGIKPEQLERMFEPFTQEDRSLARTRGGLGLGLALSKGLVELQGGTIAVGSAGPGKGSEFTVTLPLAQPVEQRAPAAGEHGSRAPRRVLVIEDNLDAARTLADVLTLEGHEVAVARNGRDGIALARAQKPHVVICDLGLPDLDGYEVARILRNDGALGATRLIALSGYAQPEDIERAKEAGFDAHLSKPAPLDDLAAMLA